MAKLRLNRKSVPCLQRLPLSYCCIAPWAKAFVSQNLGHLLCQIQIIDLGLQSPELTSSSQTCSIHTGPYCVTSLGTEIKVD